MFSSDPGFVLRIPLLLLLLLLFINYCIRVVSFCCYLQRMGKPTDVQFEVLECKSRVFFNLPAVNEAHIDVF
jgi:hypothetical protein